MPDAGNAKPATATTTGLVQVGSYRLVQPLGSGGMSSVFRATHVETGHEVALKVLPRTLAKNATLLQRFLREAKSAEALEHPNIVAIFDRGSEDGRYYLVLEYVPGGDLHDRVRERGALPVSEAVKVIRGVAEGLRHAQARGLIHRDIKPANILLTPDGTPKLADLGLAVQIEEEDERVTRDGTTVGTVDYMAPEQARDSRATSIRSDIYSLGCTFYHILAGTAPFAGGGVPEKLRRHASEAPPDVRKVRPDVPEPLARLIQRMMAKKPDARPKDYDELTTALDRLDLAPSGGGEPLFALIDDEDAIEVEGPIVPTGSTAEASTIPPKTGAARPAVRPRPEPPRAPEVSLAELASLDEDEPPARKARPRPPSAAPMPTALLDDEDESIPLAGATPLRPLRTDDTDLRDWILRGVMIGVAIVLVGFGLVQLMNLQFSTPTPSPEPEGTAETGSTESPQAPRPIPAPRLKPKAEPPRPAPALAWTEPTDPTLRELPPEPELPPGAAAPDWTRTEPAIDGPTVIVRRLDADRSRETVATLERALETVGGTTEFRDNGPFFTSEVRIGSKPKRLRSAPGHRATVVVGPPSAATAEDRSALIELDGQDVVLEGLDLVVPAGNLPTAITALVSCRGGSLTLRDCTVSVVGPPERPLTAFRLSGAGPRLRLERTSVRGEAVTLVEFADGSGRAWLARSVGLCGAAPAVVVARTDGLVAPRSRELAVLRSVIASRRPFLDIQSSPAAPGNTPTLAVQAAGSTLARVQGGGPCPLASTRGGAARLAVEWSGDANTYAGWAGWLAPAGEATGARVADLSAARATWSDIEASSREANQPWPDPQPHPWSREGLETLAPAALATLRRVAWPEPRVRLDTVETYARLEPAAGPPPADRTLTFDADDPRFGGDLGRFLAAQDLTGARLVAVEVHGQGRRPLTPIRMTDGVGLSVTVTPSASGESLSWTANQGAGALFEVHGAPLVLNGVRILDPGRPDVGDYVRVVEGSLWLTRCLLRQAAGPSQRGGALVRFVATSTKALGAPAEGDQPAVPPGPLPSAVLIDCALIAAERALVGEVGCGVIALRNCAVAADGMAVELLPVKVARDRFRADVQLDRCTIAAGRTFVALGPWPGAPEGPQRPWAITSEASAFLDGYDHAGALRDRSVLLRADPDALARGALSWQGNGNTLDVVHFLGPPDAAPPSNPRPDVLRDWVELWGEARVGRVAGPGRNATPVTVRLRGEKLRPGGVTLPDLELESTGLRRGRPPEIGADLRLLSLAPKPAAQPGTPPQPKTKGQSPGLKRRLETPL